MDTKSESRILLLARVFFTADVVQLVVVVMLLPKKCYSMYLYLVRELRCIYIYIYIYTFMNEKEA